MKKVLIISPNWLGDAIMSLPLIGMLGADEDLELSVMAPEYTARAYMGLEGVTELTVLPARPRKRRLTAAIKSARSLHAHAAIILPPSFSSAIAPFAAGVRERIGYKTDCRGMLLTSAVSAKGVREEHLSKNYLRLGKELFKKLQKQPPPSFEAPAVKTFPNERKSVDKILANKNAPTGSFAVVVPGAAYGAAKAWPENYFRNLVERLSHRLPTILGGSKKEHSLCTSIAESLENVFNFAGETTLGEFIALLEKAEVVIANDSGAPHVAASLGVPVVVIFGSTSPLWTAPLGKRVEVVSNKAWCSPCFLKECPEQLQCFQEITPEIIEEKVDDIIKKKSR